MKRIVVRLAVMAGLLGGLFGVTLPAAHAQSAQICASVHLNVNGTAVDRDICAP